MFLTGEVPWQDFRRKGSSTLPHLLEERGVDGAKVVRIHDGLTLNLRKASVAAPTLVVHEHENGKPIVRFYKGDDIDRNLHEDEKQLATLMVSITPTTALNWTVSWDHGTGLRRHRRWKGRRKVT
ncbi:hypothetical protein MTO96_014767 [Rhipicephalus appendiculatus]